MSPPLRSSRSTLGSRLWNYVQRCIRIDTRTLAVFRVLVGVLIIADLALRSRNFTYFYTEDGVVPRSLAMELSAEYAVSIYHLTTDPTLIAALFVLQGLVALQLLVGYRTRVATVLSFLFVVSLDHHNPFVLSYADTLFRLLLFWAIFLPLGERWSIDAVHGERESRPYVANAASALILLQMIYMYFTNGLIKSQSGVWTSGDAAPLVLAIDEITFLLGDFVAQFSTLLGIGGLLWFLMLVGSWLLLVLRGRPRMLLVGLFVGGHLAFAVTVRIGAFPYVALAGVLLFLQAQFWDDAAAVLNRLGIDGSGLAARATNRLEQYARRVPDPRVRGERATRLRKRAYAVTLGLVVVTVLFVAVVMAGAVGLALLEGGEEPMEERVEGTVQETLAETTGVRQVEMAASSLGIDQPIGWGVFAGPDPRTEDRYYVFAAETESGEAIDVYNERELSYDRPYDGQLQQQYDTYRERFYMNSVRRGGYHTDVPVQLGEHVCDGWADDHGEELVAVTMYMVGEDVTHETIDKPADRDREFTRIYRHGCGDNNPKIIQPPE